MRKKLSVFLSLCLLAACSSVGVKQVPSAARGHKRVDFFSGGQTQAAFKVTVQLNDGYLQGVLRVKKVGAEDYDVLLLGEGAYKYMEALVSPAGVAYRQLFKDADTSVGRARIGQFLRLLLAEPGAFAGYRSKDGFDTLTYTNKDGKVRLKYPAGGEYPSLAVSSTLLNTAELAYDEYTPYGTNGEEVPHVLVYRDGGVTLDMELISVK